MHYQDAVVWKEGMEVARGMDWCDCCRARRSMGCAARPRGPRFRWRRTIAQGWTRETPRDKAHFLAIAHGSLSESETLLTLCEDIGWFPVERTVAARFDGRDQQDVTKLRCRRR